jgi:hypothetical protein
MFLAKWLAVQPNGAALALSRANSWFIHAVLYMVRALAGLVAAIYFTPPSAHWGFPALVVGGFGLLSALIAVNLPGESKP